MFLLFDFIFLILKMPLSDKLFGAFIFSGVIVISVRANFFWLHKRKLMANEYGKSSSNSEVECGTVLMSQENIKKIHSLVSESHDMQNDQNFCELKIVNELEEIVIICWVDESGNLHHFYPINDRSIKDGSVENCHTEFTQTGHAFLILKSNHRKMKKICEATDEVNCLHSILLHHDFFLHKIFLIFIGHYMLLSPYSCQITALSLYYS